MNLIAVALLALGGVQATEIPNRLHLKTITTVVTESDREGRQYLLAFLRERTDWDVYLERDIDNPYDAMEVAVFVEGAGVHALVGYLNRDLAVALSSFLDKGGEIVSVPRRLLVHGTHGDTLDLRISFSVFGFPDAMSSLWRYRAENHENLPHVVPANGSP